MARFGSPFSAGYGAPDNHLDYMYSTLAESRAAVAVRLKPATGWGGAWFGFYLDGAFVRKEWLVEAQERVVTLPILEGLENPTVTVLRMFRRGPDRYEMARVSRSYLKGRHAILEWTNAPLLDAGFSNYTSAWTLAGLTLANCDAVQGWLTRRTLSVALTVAGGTATVTVTAGSTVVASGSGAVGTSVTLTAQNSSGISGSVAVDGGAASEDFLLYCHWPTQCQILRGTSNPPTVVVATEDSAGRYQQAWRDADGLATGTYYYAVRPIRDTGDVGDLSAVVAVAIVTPPAPPYSLRYWQGNAGLVYVAIGPSATASCTYNLYLAQPGGALNLNEIAATYTESLPLWTPLSVVARYAYRLPTTPNGYIYRAETGGTTAATEPVWPTVPGTNVTDGTVLWSCQYASVTLPAITGYPGTARVVCRAVKDGVEEDNLNVLDLEFDASGNYVAPRPNVPYIDVTQLVVTNGLNVAVKGIYQSAGEKGVATQLWLFSRGLIGDTEYDWESPIATVALDSGTGTIKTATLSAALPAAGWYYLILRAATAENVLSEVNVQAALETPVFVSDVNLPAPVDVQGWRA